MLSIIIPALNEEKYIGKLLESIKRQDVTDYEVIVADAGSTDRTLSIAGEFGARVVAGGLPAVGRNAGAAAANGDLLMFVDADIVISPHFLRRAVERFEKKKLGIAGFWILPSDGDFIDAVFFNLLDIFSFLTQRWLPYTACIILVKKSVHKKIGGFNEKILFIEDYPYGKAASAISRYSFMASLPFHTSVRRFRKDGRFTVYFKYITGQLHMLFLGPITSDRFKYKFSHYDDEDHPKK